MRIYFYAGACIPIHAYSLDERPLGGTETGLIRVAAALQQRGYDVTVFTSHKSPPTSVPRYLPARMLLDAEACDVFIAVQDWSGLFTAPIRSQRIFFWTGDGSEQYFNFGIGDLRSQQRIDILLTASNWHADNLCSESGFPLEKTVVIGNGVHLPYFQGEEIRNRKRLIYTSAPYRGLALVPKIFQELKHRIPEVELSVITGFKLYDRETPYQGREVQGIAGLLQLLAGLPGCFVQDNVKQQQLAREYMKSGILFYPNTVRETCCITALEAQAAGCPVVTSVLGALPETVGDGGFVVSGEPGSSQYQQAFIDITEKLLKEEDFWQEVSEQARTRIAKSYSWEHVADRFERVLRS